jgi:transposase
MSFTCNLDANLYSQIINDHLNPFVADNFNDGAILHQDNDPKHSSKIRMNALEDARITWVISPPQSPDLNPIEMLWADLKRFIRKQQCRSVSDVQSAIRTFHNSLTPEKCIKYIDRLHMVNFHFKIHSIYL